MTPAQYDFTVVRGAAGPAQGLTVRLKTKDADGNLANMVFDDVRLTVNKRSTLLFRTTLGDGIEITDGGEAEVQWSPTTAQTRLLAVGAKNQYELEVRNGASEVVYLAGTITGFGGINDDEDDPS